MSHGEVLVMGGTSDARALCQQLDAAQVPYTLSVATPTGQQLAGDIRGQVRCGRLELEEMIAWLKANRTRWVIDASHPYAEAVSRNIVRACETAGVLLSRYQRPEQLSGLTHPLLYTVESIEQACEVARRFGQRVLLTTGSKDLARWRAGLGDKTLLARVLPVADVIAQCAALGFGVGEIFALCGPLSSVQRRVQRRFLPPVPGRRGDHQSLRGRRRLSGKSTTLSGCRYPLHRDYAPGAAGDG